MLTLLPENLRDPVSVLEYLMSAQHQLPSQVPFCLEVHEIPTADAPHADNVVTTSHVIGHLAEVLDIPETHPDSPAVHDNSLNPLLDASIESSEPLGMKVPDDMESRPELWPELFDSEPLCAMRDMMIELQNDQGPTYQEIPCPTHEIGCWQVYREGPQALAINAAALDDAPVFVAVRQDHLAWLKARISEVNVSVTDHPAA